MSNVKAPKKLGQEFQMKREESPFDFLDGIEKLSSTPIHYLPGYKMLPGYVEPIVETEPEPEPEPIHTLEEERELLKTDPHNFVRSKIRRRCRMWCGWTC